MLRQPTLSHYVIIGCYVYYHYYYIGLLILPVTLLVAIVFITLYHFHFVTRTAAPYWLHTYLSLPRHISAYEDITPTPLSFHHYYSIYYIIITTPFIITYCHYYYADIFQLSIYWLVTFSLLPSLAGLFLHIRQYGLGYFHVIIITISYVIITVTFAFIRHVFISSLATLHSPSLRHQLLVINYYWLHWLLRRACHCQYGHWPPSSLPLRFIIIVIDILPRH